MQKIIDDRQAFVSALEDSANDLCLHPEAQTVVLDILNHIKTDKENHFVSKSQDDCGKISYARNINDKFDSYRRVKTSFERYIRRQLQLGDCVLSDHILNYWGRKLRTKLFSEEELDSRVTLLSGSEISSFYRDCEIESCMTGDNSRKTTLYKMNQDHIKLAVLDGEKARGLLWFHDSGTIILDRTYPNNSDNASTLRAWAEKKGYVTRVSDSACYDEEIKLSDGKSYEFKLVHNDVFPFMDTFCYGRYYSKYITVCNVADLTHNIIFQSTDGIHIPVLRCKKCNLFLTPDITMYYGEHNYCTDCFHKEFAKCHFCYTSCRKENMIFANVTICKNCYNCSTVTCSKCGKSKNYHLMRRIMSFGFNEKFECVDCSI